MTSIEYQHFHGILSTAVVGLRNFAAAVDEVLEETRKEINTTYTMNDVQAVFGDGYYAMLNGKGAAVEVVRAIKNKKGDHPASVIKESDNRLNALIEGKEDLPDQNFMVENIPHEDFEEDEVSDLETEYQEEEEEEAHVAGRSPFNVSPKTLQGTSKRPIKVEEDEDVEDRHRDKRTK